VCFAGNKIITSPDCYGSDGTDIECDLVAMFYIIIFNHQYGRKINIIEIKKINLTTVNHNWAYYHTLGLTQFSITEIHNTIEI